jgi:hypothetical protein
MLSVVMLSIVMLNAVMLNVVMLNVVMLNVVMLSVVAPPFSTERQTNLNVYTKVIFHKRFDPNNEQISWGLLSQGLHNKTLYNCNPY